MNRLALLLAIAAAFATDLSAQTPVAVPVAPAVTCPPTATLDQLVKAIDNAVSGPADQDRTCFHDIFLPDARLMPVVKGKDGAFAPHILTVDGWIEAVRKRGNGLITEHQLKVATETYGHIAHLWSTYETSSSPDGKAGVRGINSIQAVFDGQRWKIISIEWQAETTAEQIPEKYLP